MKYVDTAGNVIHLLPLYEHESRSRCYRWLWMFIPHRHDHVIPGRYRMTRCSRCWRAMHCDWRVDPAVWGPYEQQRLRAYKPSALQGKPMKKKCSHCEQALRAGYGAHGWCGACYQRWMRAGKPASGPPPADTTHTADGRKARLEDLQFLLDTGLTDSKLLAKRMGVHIHTLQSYRRELATR
jgi:hypothetical protein